MIYFLELALHIKGHVLRIYVYGFCNGEPQALS